MANISYRMLSYTGGKKGLVNRILQLTLLCQLTQNFHLYYKRPILRYLTTMPLILAAIGFYEMTYILLQAWKRPRNKIYQQPTFFGSIDVAM